MNKCVFCKKENDLCSLKVSHLEEDLGPGIVYKVCGTCWEAVFEIALKAAEQYLEDKMNKYVKLRGVKISDESILLRSRLIFESYLALASTSDINIIHHSLDGRSYLLMSDIREGANIILAGTNEAGGGGANLTPQEVSKLIRNVLLLEVGKRQGVGVPVFIDEERISNLKEYFSISV